MLSGEAVEGHDLVMLAPNQKHPKPLSCELLEPKPCINFADVCSLYS